jgi:hypothetical protein
MSTGKRTTLTQCTEHLGKHYDPEFDGIPQSSGTTIAQVVNVQHISIFGICVDVRHFSQHLLYIVTINSHNGQLTLPLNTNSHASDASDRFRQRRIMAGGKDNIGRQSKLLYSEITISETIWNRTHVHVHVHFFA